MAGGLTSTELDDKDDDTPSDMCKSSETVNNESIENCKIDSVMNEDRIANLLYAIETRTKEKNEIRDALRSQVRAFEQFESYVISKADAKEKELRHFLVPRPLVSEPENPTTSQSTTSTIAPILSTVPAVRPVPTLIGGATNGLLGPVVGFSSGACPSTLTQHAARSDFRNTPSETAHNMDDSLAYNTVPVDASVNLVLSRLRRLQHGCNTLVATNQTELQSLTFTQNSQNGKRIMMRVRVLEQENEELTKAKHTGRAARLQTEIALRRGFVQDLKQTYADMEYLVEEVENETDLLGSTLLVLQQRLTLAKVTAQVLACELESMEPGRAASILLQANWSPFDLPLDSTCTGQAGSSPCRSSTIVSPNVSIKPNGNDWPQRMDSSPRVDECDELSPVNDRFVLEREAPLSIYPLKRNNHFMEQTARDSSNDDDDENSKSPKRSRNDATPPPHSRKTTISRPTIPITGPQRTLNSSNAIPTPVHEALERTHELDFVSDANGLVEPLHGLQSPNGNGIASNDPSVVE